MDKPATTICVGLAFFIAAAAATAAQGQKVPTLDIAGTCRGIARHAGGPGERGGPDLSYKRCVSSELRIRRRMARRWSIYTVGEKTDCVRDTTALGVASYTDLATCLELERAARQSGFPAPPGIER